jgi:hypothetical protein
MGWSEVTSFESFAEVNCYGDGDGEWDFITLVEER